jgi:hypothetical protein
MRASIAARDASEEVLRKRLQEKAAARMSQSNPMTGTEDQPPQDGSKIKTPATPKPKGE